MENNLRRSIAETTDSEKDEEENVNTGHDSSDEEKDVEEISVIHPFRLTANVIIVDVKSKKENEYYFNALKEASIKELRKKYRGDSLKNKLKNMKRSYSRLKDESRNMFTQINNFLDGICKNSVDQEVLLNGMKLCEKQIMRTNRQSEEIYDIDNEIQNRNEARKRLKLQMSLDKKRSCISLEEPERSAPSRSSSSDISLSRLGLIDNEDNMEDDPKRRRNHHR
jgi:hypothetical protein